jgi:hypothetical protein
VPAFQTYRSSDGRNWSAGTPVAGAYVDYLAPPGRLADGRWAMVGRSDLGSLVLTSADGLTWDVVSLDGVVKQAAGPNESADQTGSAFVGKEGIAVGLWVTPDPIAERGGVKMSKDGVTITITDQHGGATITDDATGAVLGTTRSIWSAQAGTPVLRIEQGPASNEPANVPVPTTICVGACNARAGGQPEYVVLDPTTGAVRARFTNDMLNEAMVSVNEQRGYARPKAMLLTSIDGVAWSITDPSEIAGEAITTIAAVDFYDGKMIVRAQTARTLAASDPNNPAYVQVALIATPKS